MASIRPWVLLIPIPLVAAFALDMDTFVPFFLVFCVAAGLIGAKEKSAPQLRERAEHGSMELRQ